MDAENSSSDCDRGYTPAGVCRSRRQSDQSDSRGTARVAPLLRLALVVLLVGSIFAVASTGTVAAYDSFGSCVDDRGPGWTLSCFTSHEQLHDKSKLTADSQSQSYYGMESLSDRVDSEATVTSNTVEATRTMAYRKAEASFARAMANGTSKSQAQAAADKAVTNYLEDTIRNQIIRRNNAYVADYRALRNTSGVNPSCGNGGNKTLTVWESSRPRNFTVAYLSYNGYEVTSLPNGWITTTGSGCDISYSSDSYSTVTAFGSSKFPISSYTSIRGEVVNEISNFASSVNKSQFDNLSASDIPSPITQATEFGQAYNETGSSGYASALAASAGLSADVGTTYHVELLEAGEHYNGTLYAEESQFPNNSIEVNTTYDGQNQTVWLATNSGETLDINQDWMVHGITLSDGNMTNATTLSDYSRQSLNATSPLETLNDWMSLQEQVETAGSGGFFGGSSLLAFIAGIVILLVLVGGKELFGDSVSNAMDRRSRRKQAKMKRRGKMRRTQYKEQRKTARQKKKEARNNNRNN